MQYYEPMSGRRNKPVMSNDRFRPCWSELHTYGADLRVARSVSLGLVLFLLLIPTFAFSAFHLRPLALFFLLLLI